MINIKNMANTDYHKEQIEYRTKQIDKDAPLNDPLIPLCAGAIAREAGRDGTPFTVEEWERVSMGYNAFKEDWYNHPLNANAQKLDTKHKPIKVVKKESSKDRVAMTELIPTTDKSISVFFAAQSKEVQDEMLVEQNRILVEELYPMIREYAMYEKENKKYYAEDVSFITHFTHLENRSVEPFLHAHICIANSVVGHDGKTYALENQGLHDNVSLMDAAYQAAWANYLRRRFDLKLVATETKPDRANEHLDASQKNVQSFSVAGVPADAIALYSKRSADIAEELERLGAKGHTAAEIAQATTRSNKTEMSASQLRNMWRAELDERFAFNSETSHQLRDVQVVPRAPQTEQELVEGFHRRTGEVSGSEAQVKAHLYKQLMLIYPTDVVETKVASIFERHFKAATTPETRDLYERIQTSSDPQERMALQHRLITKAQYVSNFYLKNEQQLHDDFKAREAETNHVIPHHIVAKGLKDFQARNSLSGKPLAFNAGQMNAAFTMLTKPGAAVAVQGKAGAGKTSVVVAVKEIAERCGYRMIGTATSSQASSVLLKESGIAVGHNTTTLLMKLKGADGKPPTLKLTDKDIVVLDEAGMTSGHEMCELGKFVNQAGSKLILMGDKDQVQSVGASSIFRHFTQQFECAELNEIQRQGEQWQREAVTNASRGQSMDSILSLQAHDRISVSHTTPERIELIARDYLEDPTSERNKFILASLNEDADKINREVQRQQLKRGDLNTEMGVAVVVDREGYERHFHVGERVVFNKATKTDDPTSREKANNSQTGRVVRIEHRKGEFRAMTIELDSGKHLTLGVAKCRNLKLGACITTHKSQGSTVKNSYLFGSNMLNNLHTFYVQLSRHKDNTKLYLSEDQVEKIARDRKLVKPSPAQQNWARDLIAKDLESRLIDEEHAKHLRELTETFQGCREYLNDHHSAWKAESNSPRQKVMEVKTLAQFVHIFEAMGKANYKKSTFDLAVLSEPLQESLREIKLALSRKSRNKEKLPQVLEIEQRQAVQNEIEQKISPSAPQLSPLVRAAVDIKKPQERGMSFS